MATRAVQQVVEFMAWDTSADAPKTGDSANFTLRWVKDGTASATTNSASEVDSTNCPGLYKVTLTSTETDCLFGALHGKSSTANVYLIPVQVGFEQIPNAVPGAAGGLFIAGTNAPVTITGSGTALTLSSSGGNGAGMAISGNGSGAGLSATGGATGVGFRVIGGATSGRGMYVTSTANNDNAFEADAHGTGKDFAGTIADAASSTFNNATADALLDRSSAAEGYTPRQILRLLTCTQGAKVAGAATTTVTVRDVADSKDRVTATVDANGNRTAITLDLT